MARISYPDLKQLESAHPDLVNQIRGERGGLPNLYQVLLSSPEFARGWLNQGTAVRFKGSLPDSLRELVILKVGLLLRSGYEWAQHVGIARQAGVTEDQLRNLAHSFTSPHFSERERIALEYTAVVTQQVSVPDNLFERVRAHFTDPEILELTVTIGFYNQVARVLIALRIDLDPGLEPAPFEAAH